MRPKVVQRGLLLLLIAVLLLACGASPSRRVAPTRSPAAAPDPLRLIAPEDREDGVGTFTSIPWGFETNTFWIEGPTGVVVIDTQFLPSEAERAIERIARETGKPIELAIVLHPNPDKFNGADVFRAHGVRVVTSRQVSEHVPAVAAQRRRAFLARYAPDYPAGDPALEPFGDATTTLEAGGLALRAHVLGRGCSEAHVVVEWNGHVFGGDLLISRTHAWLELGHVREWLARVDEIAALSPRRVHPGRGPSGGPEILAGTRRYLSRVLELVAEARPSIPAPDGALDAIRQRIVDEHPSHAYAVFLYGLAAVWENEATRPAR
jgi:glyoxylase-like metal-dependent hydrolase (beta-lactamase superfamily II)